MSNLLPADGLQAEFAYTPIPYIFYFDTISLHSSSSRKAWNLLTEYCFGSWQWRTITPFCQTSCFLSHWWKKGRKYNGSCASTGLTKQQSPARQTKRGLTWPANWLRLIVCWKLNKMSIISWSKLIRLFSWSHVDSVQKFWAVGTTDLGAGWALHKQ